MNAIDLERVTSFGVEIEGDEVYVKCIGMERGKVKLSRKAALSEEDAAAEAEAAEAAQQASN